MNRLAAKRYIPRMIAGILAALLLSGCLASDAVHKEPETVYSSYRDVPGVTEEEIRAVEAFKREGRTFSYGAVMSSETFVDQNGGINGYTALLCGWMTEFFGIPFEVSLLEWDELLSGLETDEVDFTGELTATPERRRVYVMTDAIAERLIKSTRLAESESLSDIASARKLKLVFLKDTVTADEVRARLGKTFETVWAADYAKAYELLQTGAADAFVDENTAEASFASYGDIVVEDFLSLIYSPVSLSTQNQENAVIISIMQRWIENGGLRYLAQLYNHGKVAYTKNRLFTQLTGEEAAYIHSTPVIQFAAERDHYPVSFYNEYDEEFQGICCDVLEEVSRITGLRFEQVNDKHDSPEDIMQMLERGEASMISKLTRTPEREGRFLWSQMPILTDDYALLSKTDTDNISINELLYMKVGLVEGYAHAKIFRSWFPDHRNIILYDSFAQAFEGLAAGETDLVMGSQNQLLIQTNYRELPGYKANLVFDYSYDAAFGFNQEEVLLRSVLDKSLCLIDTQSIADSWMQKTYDYRTKVAESRLPWLIGALLSLFGVLALLIVLYKRSRREVSRMVLFQNVIMETMAEIVEYHDTTTGGHIERTSGYLALLLKEISARDLYKEETSHWDTKQMVLSAQLHDVGKVAIPNDILSKPSALTEEEFEQMKQHTVIGGEIIEKIQRKNNDADFLAYARIFAMHHHEKWDGTGYPAGMKGTQIPLAARMMAIIDVYDALLSERPYKKAFTPELAAKIIEEGKGTHFDPALADLFLEAVGAMPAKETRCGAYSA